MGKKNKACRIFSMYTHARTHTFMAHTYVHTYGHMHVHTHMYTHSYICTHTCTHIRTHSWNQGEITNFEYLMELNKLSGRTFNDLMQYPVFPFILADYQDNNLDLKALDSFRYEGGCSSTGLATGMGVARQEGGCGCTYTLLLYQCLWYNSVIFPLSCIFPDQITIYQLRTYVCICMQDSLGFVSGQSLIQGQSCQRGLIAEIL